MIDKHGLDFDSKQEDLEPADLEEDGEVMMRTLKRWRKRRKMMVLKMPTTMSGTMGERMRDHRPLNLCKGSLNQEPLRFFSVR